jgi:hypothetical protein
VWLSRNQGYGVTQFHLVAGRRVLFAVTLGRGVWKLDVR